MKLPEMFSFLPRCWDSRAAVVPKHAGFRPGKSYCRGRELQPSAPGAHMVPHHLLALCETASFCSRMNWLVRNEVALSGLIH